MRLKEQKLWDAMRSNTTPATRLYRVENMIEEGIPDVMALSHGWVTWCELKAVLVLPRRTSTRVLGNDGLSVAQRNWHMTWNQNGGRALIVIGIGQGALRQHIAVHGRHGDRLNDMTWNELLSNACCAGVGASFWPKLEILLSGAFK